MALSRDRRSLWACERASCGREANKRFAADFGVYSSSSAKARLPSNHVSDAFLGTHVHAPLCFANKKTHPLVPVAETLCQRVPS